MTDDREALLDALARIYVTAALDALFSETEMKNAPVPGGTCGAFIGGEESGRADHTLQTDESNAG